MKKINERSTVALDDAIFNFAEALTHILAVNLGMLYDDVDNDEDSTIDFDEEAEKRTINVYKFAAGADGKVGKDEIFTCQCLAHQFNSDDSRDRYYNFLAEDLGAHLERIWLQCEDEDEFVDAATQLLRGLVAAAQFTDAGRLDGGEKRKMLNQINRLVEAYVLAGGGMGVNENTKVTLTLKQLKKLVKEGRYTNAPTPDKQKELNKLFIAGFKELFDTISRYFVDSTVFNGGYYAVVNTNDGVQSILTCFKEIAKAAGDIMIDDEEADNIDEIVNKIENQANQICKGEGGIKDDSDDADVPTTVSEDDDGPVDVDAAVKDLFDMYRACKVEPKVCNAIKADGEKTNIFLGRGNSVGGIAKALRDGRLLKVIGFN